MLFDRERELALLRSHIMMAPRGILVILGPQSCGKSTIVSHCLSGIGAFGSYMDGRGGALQGPAVFATALSKQQADWMEWIKSYGSVVQETINLAQVTFERVSFGVGPLVEALTKSKQQNPELKLQVRIHPFLCSDFNAVCPTFALQRDKQLVTPPNDTKQTTTTMLAGFSIFRSKMHIQYSRFLNT